MADSSYHVQPVHFKRHCHSHLCRRSLPGCWGRVLLLGPRNDGAIRRGSSRFLFAGSVGRGVLLPEVLYGHGSGAGHSARISSGAAGATGKVYGYGQQRLYNGNHLFAPDAVSARCWLPGGIAGIWDTARSELPEAAFGYPDWMVFPGILPFFAYLAMNKIEFGVLLPV